MHDIPGFLHRLLYMPVASLLPLLLGMAAGLALSRSRRPLRAVPFAMLALCAALVLGLLLLR